MNGSLYCSIYFKIFSLSVCLQDNWQYKETICPDDWLGHNGFCYRYLEKKSSWDGSLSACKSLEAELVSVHSLSQQELLLKLLSNGWLDVFHFIVSFIKVTVITICNWLCQDPTLRCGSACTRRLNFQQSNGQTTLLSHSHPGPLRSLPINMATSASVLQGTRR